MEKMERKVWIVLILFIIPLASAAQTSVILKEQGLAKLNVFEGTWQSEGIPNDGKVTAISTCKWSANGKYLIADQVVTNNGKVTNNLSIYSYNPDKDNYTLSLVGVPGMAPFAIPITAKGDTLIYSSDYTNNGKKVYNRTLNIFATKELYSYEVQSSTDSIHWETFLKGRSVKIKP